MSGIDTEMKFEELRDSIITLLETYSTGRFRVIKGQVEDIPADQLTGTNRVVQIFYGGGDFPKNKSTKVDLQHDFQYTLQLYISAPCKGDKAVIESDTATSGEKAAALLAITGSQVVADIATDELIRMIVQILMSPTNEQLGMPMLDSNGDPVTGYTQGLKQVSSRWVSNIRKSQPLDRGNLVLIPATMTLSGILNETVTGLTPVSPDTNTFDIEHEFNTQSDPDDADPAISGVQIDAT